MELLLVENVWCQKQSWSLMHLLCSVMVGFGLRQNLGTAGKEHDPPPLPPPKIGEALMMMMISMETHVSRIKFISAPPTFGGGKGEVG